MSWTVIEADGNGVRETRRGGTLTGETEVETSREDTMAMTDIASDDLLRWARGVQKTCRGGTQPIETEPEPMAETELEPEPEPEPEPKPKLVTWRWCVRIRPDQINDPAFYNRWYESGEIPEHWYPIEAYTQPIETVQQLPEGQEP